MAAARLAAGVDGRLTRGRWLLWVRLLLGGVCCAGWLPAAATSAAPAPPAVESVQTSETTDGAASEAEQASPGAAADESQRLRLRRYIEQLGAPSYHRRLVAMRKLEAAGRKAIEPLEEAVLSGNLEVVDRACYILQALAAREEPEDPPQAWDALQRLKQRGPGSAATRAMASMERIREERSARAQTRLAASGLQVGVQEVRSHISLQGTVADAIYFPADWEIDTEALGWTRWLYSTTMVVMEGDAVTEETMAAVAKLPNLVDVQIQNASLSPTAFAHLKKLERIDSLELHFVDVGGPDQDFRTMLDLPLRKLLVMTATQFDRDDVAAFRTHFDGLEIIFSRGGFLGVQGAPTNGPCRITHVVPDSAADRAGLQPDDTITRLGETKIEKFTDLQEAIREHPPGAKVKIEFSRGGETIQSVVDLGRL